MRIENSEVLSQVSDVSKAFTLAEVLITLAVIGVVAAVTMPILMTNINERVNSERQANIVYKFNQAMEHMRSQGKLTAYASTEDFVNELQKHMKITKVCDKDHIAECWPTETVTNAAGEEYEVSDAKIGKNLSINRTNNNVGLILADGASIILNFDTSFQGMDIGDLVKASPIGLPNGNGKSKVYLQYTINLMSPLSFVMDVNGKKGPNKETFEGKYHDIRSFGGASFTEYDPAKEACIGDYYKEKGQCLYYVGTAYTSINCLTSNSDDPLYSYCYPTPGWTSTDYWAGAKAKCASIGMTLPNTAQFRTFYADRSNYPSIINNYWYYTSEEDSMELANIVYFGYDDSYGINLGDSYGSNNYFHRPIICIK